MEKQNQAVALLKKIGATAVVATTSVPAFAAEGDIDVSAVLAVITKVGTAAGLIGVAVLGILAAIKGYKMVRAAM